MEELNRKKQAAAELKDTLERLSKDGRFTVASRVNHIRRVQKVDGVELYAVQYTTIQRAAQTDNVAGVRFFIKRGDLNKQDQYGNTALHEACRYGYTNVVTELAEHGADVNCRNNIGQTAAHLAVAGGQPQLLEQLFDMGGDLLIADNGGATPAHYAAQVNRVDILEQLYSLQERPLSNEVLSVVAKNGLTPAHVAAQFGCVEALDLMARFGVSLNGRDAMGETPAHKAARGQHFQAVRLLQKLSAGNSGGKGADFSAANLDEDSADDLLADRSRHANGSCGVESLKSLRELAKMRRDGELSHSDFMRLKNRAIGAGQYAAGGY